MGGLKVGIQLLVKSSVCSLVCVRLLQFYFTFLSTFLLPGFKSIWVLPSCSPRRCVNLSAEAPSTRGDPSAPDSLESAVHLRNMPEGSWTTEGEWEQALVLAMTSGTICFFSLKANNPKIYIYWKSLSEEPFLQINLILWAQKYSSWGLLVNAKALFTTRYSFLRSL